MNGSKKNEHPGRRKCASAGYVAVLVAVALLIFASPAHAYMGPGGALTAIGTILALLAAVFMAVLGFFWYPIRRMLRRRRESAEEDEESSDDAPEDSSKQ